MILLAALAAIAVAMAVLYSQLGKQPDRRSLWRATVRLGLRVGIARAGLASLGWYVVERTGGPFQIPAYLLSMMALPEAAILGAPRTTLAPPIFFVSLSLLLIAGTMVFFGVAALAVEASRRGLRGGPT